MAFLGDLVVNLSANTRRFDSGLDRARHRLSGFVRHVGSRLAGIAGAYVAIRLAHESYTKALTQIQAEQKLAAVLKSTGHAAGLTAQQIKHYAAELQDATNFGDEMTINAAGMLATFKSIRGGVFKETIAVAQDMSAVLDQDLKSSIIQLGKALNDPAQGLTALSRVGVSFTDTQKATIQKLLESNRLFDAQRIILAELKSEFGGAAAAMADPMTQAANAIGDAKEELGKLVIEVGSSAAPKITEFSKVMGATFRAVGEMVDAAREKVDDFAESSSRASKKFAVQHQFRQAEQAAAGLRKVGQAVKDLQAETEGLIISSPLKASGVSKFEKFDEFKRIMRDVNLDLQVMRGEITDTEAMIQRMDLGVFADKVREAFGQRDALDALKQIQDLEKRSDELKARKAEKETEVREFKLSQSLGPQFAERGSTQAASIIARAFNAARGQTQSLKAQQMTAANTAALVKQSKKRRRERQLAVRIQET